MSERTAIGRYRVTGKLGEGGMGEVWAAHDDRLGRPVAIKTVRAAAGDEDSRARLWREARAAASVSHPNVCQLYEVGEDGEDVFLAMELLEGEPLSARIARGPIPIAEAVELMITVLGALEALHRRQLVHRDLKPTNVFLTPHGVKLLDFGLARQAAGAPEPDVTLTMPGYVLGTPRSMAPEQWRGEPADARTDLFAAGVLLYEMLTARPAFDGASPIEVYHAILHEQPPALAGGGSAAGVDRVIRRALEKRREQRPPSAEAMAAELRAALAAGTAPSTGEQHAVRVLTRLIVLPFRVLRPDAETDFLAFSLPDAVTQSLTGLGSLVVRSSHAAARYAGDAVDLARVAAETEVDAVLLGTLLRAGDQLRVSAQLVEAPAGTVVWSNTAQVRLEDLFQVQDELARAIVESLEVPLSAHERRQLGHDVPASPRAYRLYLEANELARTRDLDGLRRARDLYREALDEDPAYAPAWARYARCCRVLGKYGFTGDTGRDFALAGEAFGRALELNPDLALAHHLYTHLEVEIGRARDALRRLLGRARGAPADPELFAGLCTATRYCGLLDVSLAAHQQAIRLDPHVTTSVMYTHFMRADWEAALAAEARETTGFMTPYVLPLTGRDHEAREHYRALVESSDHEVLRLVGRMMAAALDRDVATCREVLEVFSSARLAWADPEGLYFVARALAEAGDVEKALDTIDTVIARGFTCPHILRVDPWLDAIRDTRRFTQLEARAADTRRLALAEFRALGGEAMLGPEPDEPEKELAAPQLPT